MKKTHIESIIAVAVFTVLSASAQAQVPCQKKPVKISVSADRLDRTLAGLSDQIDCKIKYDTKLIQTFRGNSVKGQLTPSDALIQLVKGTGLEIHADPNQFSISQTDQQAIGLEAAKLQASLGQAVKSQKLKSELADRMYAELGTVRTSVVDLAKKQGFVSAAEKASYKRTFDKAEQLLARSK